MPKPNETAVHESDIFNHLSNGNQALRTRDYVKAKEAFANAFYAIGGHYKLDLCSKYDEETCFSCTAKDEGYATHLLKANPKRMPSILTSMTATTISGLATIPQGTKSQGAAKSLEHIMDAIEHATNNNGKESFFSTLQEQQQSKDPKEFYEQALQHLRAKNYGRHFI